MNPSNINEQFYTEQNILKADVAKNTSICTETQNALVSIVKAAIASAEENNIDASTATDENVSNLSLESIQHIDTSYEDDDVSDDESTLVEEVPGLKRLLKLINQGKVKIHSDGLNELNKLNLKLEAASKVSNDLQDRLCALENSKKEHERKMNDQEQYLKLEDLLFHKFPFPYNKNLSSLQFCHYMAEQINYFLPNLPVPVTWQHISDAHPLKTKARKSKVIIVRFCNRNIRHLIYSQRALLHKTTGISITEHLTEMNLGLLRKAKELFGFKYVTTEKCRIIVTTPDGKEKKLALRRTLLNCLKLPMLITPQYRIVQDYFITKLLLVLQKTIRDLILYPIQDIITFRMILVLLAIPIITSLMLILPTITTILIIMLMLTTILIIQILIITIIIVITIA